MSLSNVKASFEAEVSVVPIDRIVPQKTMPPGFSNSTVYCQIAASLREVGLIEPLVVFLNGSGDYLLLDGHTRLDILVARGTTHVKVILAHDDETYTYNRHVNPVSPIAQHFMISEALSHGITEDKIAETLNFNVKTIAKKRRMLDGICPEAVCILEDRNVSAEVFSLLRKMKPLRQIQAAEQMCAAKAYSISFTKALLDATPNDLLVQTRFRRRRTLSAERRAYLIDGAQVQNLAQQARAAEQSYAQDVLTLSISLAYVARLLRIERIEQYLAKSHSEILGTLRMLLSDFRS